MKLTLRQQRLIRKLLLLHSQPPTFTRLLGRALVIVLAWSLVLALWVVITDETHSSLVPFCCGIVVGLLSVNLGLIRTAMSGWPIYEAVIDWTKVGAMASPEKSPNKE